MNHSVQKLLYSRRDTAEALSLSIRSVDYLITTGRLTMRRVGGKILIPASAVRRFASEDHPDSVRTITPRLAGPAKATRRSSDVSASRIEPQREGFDDIGQLRANSRR